MIKTIKGMESNLKHLEGDALKELEESIATKSEACASNKKE